MPLEIDQAAVDLNKKLIKLNIKFKTVLERCYPVLFFPVRFLIFFNQTICRTNNLSVKEKAECEYDILYMTINYFRCT